MFFDVYMGVKRKPNGRYNNDLLAQRQFRSARLNQYFFKTIHGSVKKISKTKNVSISIKIRVDSQFGLELRKV